MCDHEVRIKRGNEACTHTQDMSKLKAEPKANSGNKVERPSWADYEDYENFEEAIDDIGDSGFEDDVVGHREGFW